MEVLGLPISIDAACSGIDLLQLLAVAGTCLALMLATKRGAFLFCIALIAPICWLANTVRIVSVISAMALTVDVDFAAGAFHTWGALFVIALVVLVSGKVFSLIQHHWPEGRVLS